MNETLPTWSELSAAGWVVLGNADLMLGVYPTVAGDVALTTQSAQDDVMRVFFVQLAELPLLIQKLGDLNFEVQHQWLRINES